MFTRKRTLQYLDISALFPLRRFLLTLGEAENRGFKDCVLSPIPDETFQATYQLLKQGYHHRLFTPLPQAVNCNSTPSADVTSSISVVTIREIW